LMANRDVIAVFNSIPLSELDDGGITLKELISKSSKASGLFRHDENVNTTIVQAKLKGDAPAILLIIPDDKKDNYGIQMANFKQRVINDFSNCGVKISKSDIAIDIRNSSYINQLISSSKQSDYQQPQSPRSPGKGELGEFDYEEKSKQFVPVEPLYSFNRVILSKDVIRKIEEAVAILECENKVFKEWGLYEIQPHPSTSLSFYGPSGTGKTMAAEAVAEKLGKKILKVSYADVESKYHGEGPKMVKSIFLAAQNSDAVLFFDEADSLLSKRLTNVSQGSEQAINSMRSQLLICLEEFRGIVIFATNLVINYDKAFLTRLISVEFPIPDEETRKKIWDVHIRPINDGKPHQLKIPLSNDVDTATLAHNYEFVGREVRNAVVGACVAAAMAGKNCLTQSDFVSACENIKKERESLASAKDTTSSADPVKQVIMQKIKQKELEKGE